MKFFKYQDCGNDYVYIDCLDQNIEIENPNELAKKISDRHFGVGSDGLILILPSSIADAKMRIFNSDGSEAEMCGNGIRCVAKYIFDNKKSFDESIARIETLAGIKILELISHNDKISRIKVNMGYPEFLNSFYLDENKFKDISHNSAIHISMGNPHLVLLCENIDFFDIKNISSKIQNLSCFKDGINIDFAQIESQDSIKVRVFERGSGETLSCGTGACAAAVAAMSSGFMNTNELIVKLKGGELLVEYTDDLVYMTGDANLVFEGEYYCD